MAGMDFEIVHSENKDYWEQYNVMHILDRDQKNRQ